MNREAAIPVEQLVEKLAPKRRYRPYPEYSDSGIEGVDALPAQWAETPLKYVASVNAQKLADTTDPDYELDYVDIGNVSLVEGITSTERFRFEDAPSRARRRVQPGDTIISTVRTYLKAVARIDNPPENLVVSTGFAVIHAGPQLDPAYLYRLVQSDSFVERVVAYSFGVSYPAINPSELVRLPIPIPPLDEQRAIAAFLDRETARIDELIAKKQRLIELLAEKRTALISHAVTSGLDPNAPMKDSGIEWLGQIPGHWETKRLKHAIYIRGGQVDPRLEEYGRMILIAPNHIESGTGRILNLDSAEEQGAISGKYLFRRGDVLYRKIRPELAKACIAPDDGLCSADMYAMVPRRGIVSAFVLYLLLSEAYTKLAVDESMRVAMPKINREDLGEIRWPFPPEAEQAEIVFAIETAISPIDTLLVKIQGSIDMLWEHRTSLISAAVTGKIDVRGEVG